MGIPGLWDVLNPAGDRIALAQVAMGRSSIANSGLRIAIDISIWSFQVQASEGGDNPVLRTMYYRLCRLLFLGVHPIFVFDGPSRPAFKRDKRIGKIRGMANYKKLIKLFGFTVWQAPGEAEAECAFLQRRGIVDAIISDDVDTLMFGAHKTFKHWGTSRDKGERQGRAGTHTVAFDASRIKSLTGLDSKDMILIALMAGGGQYFSLLSCHSDFSH